MLKRNVIVFIALVALALTFLIVTAPEIEVRITEDQVAEQIAAELPKTITKGGLEITVNDATVDFLADNAVRITAVADIAGYGMTGRADADMTSSLEYRDGDFFLTSVDFDDLRLTQDPDTEEKLSDATSVARGLFNRLRDQVEDGEAGAGAALERVADRAMDRFAPAARESVETMMTNIPVYSLNGKGMKESLAAMALKDLHFEETTAVATLSPAQLVLKILLGIAMTGVAGILALGVMMGGGRGLILPS
jgi:hypothetical protein